MLLSPQVSNSIGVNLHATNIHSRKTSISFKLHRSKFTQILVVSLTIQVTSFKLHRSKFTLYYIYEIIKPQVVSNSIGVNLHGS